MAIVTENRSVDRMNVLPSGKAASALADGDLVYLTSSGTWAIAAAGSNNAMGIMTGAALIYETVSPVRISHISGAPSGTVGAKAYLSTTGTTGNTITPTKPVGVQVQEVGIYRASTEVQISIPEQVADGSISVLGSDGKFKASYATIDLAVAATVANDIVKLAPGSYTLTAGVDITKAGTKIVGAGKNLTTIVAAAAADYAFKTVLGVLSATAELTLQGFTIDHTDDASQVGLQIQNTSATKKINVYIDDVDFETDGGNSIDIDHGDTSNAIRVYCNRCTTEGPVNMVVADAGDRFRFSYGNLRGGFVSSAGDFDAEILIAWSTFLLNGVTGGHANQRVIFVASASETDADPNVYLEAVAADVETQTPQVIAFDAP